MAASTGRRPVRAAWLGEVTGKASVGGGGSCSESAIAAGVQEGWSQQPPDPSVLQNLLSTAQEMRGINPDGVWQLIDEAEQLAQGRQDDVVQVLVARGDCLRAEGNVQEAFNVLENALRL